MVSHFFCKYFSVQWASEQLYDSDDYTNVTTPLMDYCLAVAGMKQ